MPSRPHTQTNVGHNPLQQGFTIIELLVVITIIAILAGLTLNVAGYIQKKGAWSRTETEIAALSAALESYKADYGSYPTGTNTAQSTNNGFLTSALGGGVTINNPSGKVYFEFPSKMSGGNGTNASVILDPFGNGYGYEFPGQASRSGTTFFDLWSTGGGDTNSNQWIKNW